MARATYASVVKNTRELLSVLKQFAATLLSAKNQDGSDYTLPISAGLTLDPTNLALDATVAAMSAKLAPSGLTHTVTNSADMSSVANVSAAPTSGQKVVVHGVAISVGTAMNVTLKCETSGAVVMGPFYMAANTTVSLSSARLAKLATADKRLQAVGSVSGNITVETWCSSEA